MNTLTFDKLSFVDKLKAGGFTEEQARTQADALDAAFIETVATKQDILDLRRDMKEMEMRLTHTLTLRLGSMQIIAVGAVAALVKLL